MIVDLRRFGYVDGAAVVLSETVDVGDSDSDAESRAGQESSSRSGQRLLCEDGMTGHGEPEEYWRTSLRPRLTRSMDSCLYFN